MKVFASIAAIAVTAASTLIAAPANATECRRFDGGIACSQRVSGSVERLGLKLDDGTTFVGDITCTGTRWILHDGWTGNVSRANAAIAAESYCEGRGSMFVGA